MNIGFAFAATLFTGADGARRIKGLLTKAIYPDATFTLKLSFGTVKGYPMIGRFIYDNTANRAVAVDSAAMSEALRQLYDATALVDELEGRAAKTAGNQP